MDPIKEKLRRAKEGVVDRLGHSYRSLLFAFQNTKVHQNIDSLVTYQRIYYELLN